ncbi:hypothetical protein HPB49_021781 [Dermacentor silvarum]|uniref:Uncharacterized protein n=2 Tax=Dermacentor silvarum TaxID=543639 RepID=A0ACB8CHP4_DERSI|nr:hypothetical protein HPB49_021781 [Dermacentor silvarum]
MAAPPKKGGYPSRQRRFGPAPLASFEDLPTDDQDSSPEARSPDTLVPSEVSTPQVEGDVDSLATLTPCGSVPTANGSPCSPVAPPLLEVPPPPSTDSLTPEEPQRRKGSWTELFLRGRSPQRSSGGTSPEPTKGFFSSLLKLGGRKSPRSPSPHSPSPVPTAPRLSVTLHDEQPDGVLDSLPNNPPQSVPNSMPNVVPDKAPEKRPDKQLDKQPNSLPDKQPEGNPKKWQDRTSSSKKPAGVPGEPRARPQDLEINDPFDRACLLERVCQSLADIPSASRRGSRESPEQLSSESELTLDAVLAKQSSQDEFETLLAQDSVESEEFLSVASAVAPPPPSRSPVPTRQQRLEVVTIPIERPRSTTPINIAPIEAFLPAVSPEPCPPDKIRLFLPGEQFTGRGPRSPRRSSLKSWLHFCEEGLQSPRSRKRSEDSQAAGCCDCPGPEAAHSDCACDCHHQSPGSSSLSSPEHAS